MENLPSTVRDQVRSVLNERSAEPVELEDHDSLLEQIGLTSLELARVIAKLEALTGVDPFAKHVPITSIRTLGDLCSAYSRALEAEHDGATRPDAPRPDLARQRGELRRQALSRQRFDTDDESKAR